MANEQKNQSETSKVAMSRKQIKVFQAWLNSEYGSRVPHISFNDAKSIMIDKGLTAPLITKGETHASRAYRPRVCEPLTAINSSI